MVILILWGGGGGGGGGGIGITLGTYIHVCSIARPRGVCLV